MSAATSYYELLGVSPMADEGEIRAAYRLMAKRAHPDVPGGNVSLMSRLNEAYEVLSDAAKRDRYDRQTRPRPSRPQPIDPMAFLFQVFQPLDQTLTGLVRGLLEQFEDLSGDPFDETLMHAFAAVVARAIQTSAQWQDQMHRTDIPAPFTHAMRLYEQGLRQLDDALDEFTAFQGNYDLDHLVDGRAIMLGATELLSEARDRLPAMR